MKIFIFYFLVCSPFIADAQNFSPPDDSVAVVSFSFVGDIMCHSTQFKFARVKKDSFDFKPSYEFIRPIFKNFDFNFGNLETVFAGNKIKYTGYPLFNTPDDFLEGLKYAGFDYLFTANNHSYDRFEKGVRRTIKVVKYNFMNTIGTNLSANGKKYLIVEKNNISIAVLAFSFGINGFTMPEGREYLVNLIDKDAISSQIENAKKENPDIVLVYFHFGNEYQKEPSAYQKDIVKFTVAQGADIIIASHPHVMQPVEFFKTEGGNLDTGFVAYSLGNFISNQRWRYSDASVIISFEIEKNLLSDKARLKNVSFLPLWVYKGKYKGKPQYIILPSEISLFNDRPPFLSGDDWTKMKESYEDTKSIITKRTKNIKLLHLKELFPIDKIVINF
ncbi:MAG: CapA family protein [Chlorobi bacterium]|nr:CapA family protein [Chlorobiota bacterium]